MCLTLPAAHWLWLTTRNGCRVLQAKPFLDKILQGVKIGGIPSEVYWFRAVATGYLHSSGMVAGIETLRVINSTRKIV
jgi:hypothetical protein